MLAVELPGAESFYPSEVDSGYSIDNLPPPAPVLDVIELENRWVVTWPNPDVPDLREVCLYRGYTPDFIPDEPLACGLSGSIQHFAGMKSSGMIIAINTDPNATIMAKCDYYAVADLFDVLPELQRQLAVATAKAP